MNRRDLLRTGSGLLALGTLPFPLGWTAEVHPILEGSLAGTDDSARDRWDGASVHDFSGTYGDYLLGKVSKVFPDQLEQLVLRVRKAKPVQPAQQARCRGRKAIQV